MFCFVFYILYSEDLSFVPNTNDIYRKFDPATLAKGPSLELANQYVKNLQHTQSLTLPIQKNGGMLGRHKGYIVFLANCATFLERMADQLIALFEKHVTKEQKNRCQPESKEAQEHQQIKQYEALLAIETIELTARHKILDEENWVFRNQLALQQFNAEARSSEKTNEDTQISVTKTDSTSDIWTQHKSSHFRESTAGFEIIEAITDDENEQNKKVKISDFTLTDVIDCAGFSDAAYKSSKHEAHDYLTGKVYKFGTEEGLSSGFVTEKDGTIYVSYKGTTKPRDLVTDFTAFWSFNNKLTGRFHMGILNAYLETAENMKGILKKIMEDKKWSEAELSEKLVFTGHSLGGGLAKIAAFFWRESTTFCPKVATFAAPNVMDFLTAEKYNNSFRMRDRTLTVDQMGDPVPIINVPLITGAMHVGNKLYLPYSTEKKDGVSTIIHFHGLKTYIDTLNKLSQNKKLQVTKMGFFGRHASSEVYQFEAAKNQQYVTTSLANALRGFLSAKVEANIHWLIARVFWGAPAEQTIADSGGSAAAE